MLIKIYILTHIHIFIHLTTSVCLLPIMCQALFSVVLDGETAVNIELTFIIQNLTLPSAMQSDTWYSILIFSFTIYCSLFL